MKRILASFLAIIITLSVIFSAPSIFSNVFAQSLVINNTYDESGYVNKDTNFDTASKNPIVKVVAEGRTGNALQFMRVYGSARCGTLPYTNIYDSNKSDYSFFSPTVGDTYSLTLWYNPKSNTRDTALELYGVKKADLSDGVKLADICEIPKNTSKEWREVSVIFTVNEEFNSLAIASNSFRTDSRADQYFTLLDDVKLEKVPAGDATITIHHDVDGSDEQITIPNRTLISEIATTKRVDGKRVEGFYTDNTYTTPAEGMVFGKTELWAKWTIVPSKVENTYDEAGLTKEKLSQNNIFHFGTKSAATPNTTKVVQFYPIVGQTELAKGNYTYIEIYNPDSGFESFITEPDADYKINFDFKVKAGTNGDISFNIREVVNGKVGKVIGTAAKVLKGDKDYSDYTWGKAEVVVAVTQPNTALAISIETAINSDAKLYPYLDNIVVEKVTEGDTTLTIHHDADNSDEQITLPNKTLINEIVTTKRVDGKRLEGLYTDNTCTTPAEGMVFGKTELWAKWVTVPSKVENTYDETGLTKDKCSANNLFHFGTKTAATPNTTKVVQFNPITGQIEIAKGNYTYIEIYDPNSNFESFVTEPDADYKINFDFKVKAGTYGDISFNIREIVNGKMGKIIGTAATVLKGDTNYSDYTWGKAEAVIAVTKPNTVLAISIETTLNADANLYPYLDNIVVEKVADRKTTEVTVNNYKNDGSGKTVTISKNALFTQIELDAVSGMDFMGLYTDKSYQNAAKGKIGDCNAVWAKWRDENVFDNTYEEPGIAKEKLKGKDITFLGVRESAGHDGKVLQFNKIAGQNSIADSTDNITRVEIYNPDSSEFESFIPEVNASYLITFDYKQKATKSDIRFNIREVIDGKVGEILGNAGVIKGNDPKFTTAIWAKAETIVTVTKPDTALAITIEYTGSSDGALWPYLDNVVIAKIPSPTDKKEITIHKFDGSNDKKVELPNATLFSSIEMPEIHGKKYEGMYFDKECTMPVEGAIYRYDEVWAKWRTSADADKIVNNYDDKGVYYKEELNSDRFDEKFELTAAEEKKANNYITRYSDSSFKNAIDSEFLYQNFAIGSIAQGRKGNAIQLNSASVASTTKPPLVKIYDNRDGQKKIYKPRPNTLYKLEFYMKSTQLVSKDMHVAIKGYSDKANEFGAGTFLKYCYTVKNGTVVKDWVKVETYFTVPDAEYDFLGISLMASGTAVINGKNAETDSYNVQVSIDDVSVTEVFDNYYLTVEPNNGDKTFKVPFMAGELLDTIPTVKRNGYVFAGWFTDAELKTPFTYGKMPAGNLNVYGKWEELATTPYNFNTGFEKGDFSVSYPYTNTDGNKLYSNNMTPAVTVVTNPDDVHDEGEKYLHFVIDPASSRQTMDMAAIALLNPDGTAFQVVKGTRYAIDFSLRCDTDCYIIPVVSDQTPTGRLNLTNSTEINRTWFRPYWYHNKEEWGTMKNVFIPNTSGRIYLLVYYGSTYVDIDNVKINCATSKEVVQVKFYNEKGTGVSKTLTGRVGDWMFPPKPAAKEGYVFDGWYDALDESGKVYAESVLPGDDMKLYPRYRKATPAGDNPSTVKEAGIEIDFEGSNARQLAFYQSNNDCWIGNNDVLFVVNDPDGAHSGSNYFKFNNAGQWTASEYRRFRFYNESTPDNRVYLDPLSVYKIGFWMRVDRTWSAGIRVVAFDTTDAMGVVSNQQVANLTEVETEDNYGKWIYYEGELTTGSEICTAGIMISGGFLTASIDDVTVRKMKKLVVSFDSLGGTPVGSLETFENQCVVAPLEPEREGYYFGGWYTEKNFKNLFDFNNTPIIKNITLYAKWLEIKYKDVTTYETEEITNILPIENPELDDQLNTSVAENDAAVVTQKESSPLVWIIPIVAGLVVIACGVFVFILIKRRKKKR